MDVEMGSRRQGCAGRCFFFSPLWRFGLTYDESVGSIFKEEKGLFAKVRRRVCGQKQ